MVCLLSGNTINSLDVQVALKQFEKASEAHSIDEVLSKINDKIEKHFSELIEKILSYKDKIVKDIMESPEIQGTINERKYKLDESLQTLKAIQIDVQNLIEKVQDDFNNHRYILLYERNSATEIQPLKKRLQDWRSQAASNPLKIQQLANDLCLSIKVTDQKLKSLIKASHYSHPAPQPVYDFNNENNKLLLVDMNNKSVKIVQLQGEHHIPYHFSVTLLGGKLYFVGGDEDGYKKECYSASIKKRTMTKLADISVERRNHTLAPFHVCRKIYCVGGYNKSQGVLNSVEKYDVSRNVWTAIAPMLEKRQWPGACQFNDKYLYCFGGSGLDTIERINISEEEKGWENIVLPKKPDGWIGKSALAAVQAGTGEILIFGGCVKKDVEDAFIFDPETKTMTKKLNMPIASLFCQMGPVVSGDLVGTVGWRNDNIYIYDTSKNSWTLIEADKYQMEEFAET